MSTYVYAPKLTTGTNELIEALNAKRLIKFDGLHFLHKGKPVIFEPNVDIIVCWGACVPPISGVRILNNNLKFTSALSIQLGLRYAPNIGINCFGQRLYQIANIGILKPGSFSIENPEYGAIVPCQDFPGYATQYADFKTEYEIDIFGGEILRLGKKVPLHKVVKNNWTPNNNESHPWYRSSKTGWQVKYDIVHKVKLDKLKAAAIAYMHNAGLTFGVLSFACGYQGGEPCFDYSPTLRKFVTNPELDADGVKLYVDKITKWIEAEV